MKTADITIFWPRRAMALLVFVLSFFVFGCGPNSASNTPVTPDLKLLEEEEKGGEQQQKQQKKKFNTAIESIKKGKLPKDLTESLKGDTGTGEKQLQDTIKNKFNYLNANDIVFKLSELGLQSMNEKSRKIYKKALDESNKDSLIWNHLLGIKKVQGGFDAGSEIENIMKEKGRSTLTEFVEFLKIEDSKVLFDNKLTALKDITEEFANLLADSCTKKQQSAKLDEMKKGLEAININENERQKQLIIDLLTHLLITNNTKRKNALQGDFQEIKNVFNIENDDHKFNKFKNKISILILCEMKPHVPKEKKEKEVESIVGDKGEKDHVFIRISELLGIEDDTIEEGGKTLKDIAQQCADLFEKLCTEEGFSTKSEDIDVMKVKLEGLLGKGTIKSLFLGLLYEMLNLKKLGKPIGLSNITMDLNSIENKIVEKEKDKATFETYKKEVEDLINRCHLFKEKSEEEKEKLKKERLEKEKRLKESSSRIEKRKEEIEGIIKNLDNYLKNEITINYTDQQEIKKGINYMISVKGYNIGDDVQLKKKSRIFRVLQTVSDESTAELIFDNTIAVGDYVEFKIKPSIDLMMMLKEQCKAAAKEVAFEDIKKDDVIKGVVGEDNLDDNKKFIEKIDKIGEIEKLNKLLAGLKEIKKEADELREKCKEIKNYNESCFTDFKFMQDAIGLEKGYTISDAIEGIGKLKRIEQLQKVKEVIDKLLEKSICTEKSVN